jgi:hypothetical protein
MWKPLQFALWQGAKIAMSMCLATSWMRGAVFFGATPLEAGFAVVVAAVIVGAYLISTVMDTVGDPFHPKMDELVADLGDIRRHGE